VRPVKQQRPAGGVAVPAGGRGQGARVFGGQEVGERRLGGPAGAGEAEHGQEGDDGSACGGRHQTSESRA
jgi:hypothetical protein